MEKWIPYEKLSKKEKRKMDAAKRVTWGNLNPVTRKPENSKAYNRKKALRRERDSLDLSAFSYSSYLRISPGSQFNASQMASKVEKRMAFTLLFLIFDKFTLVMPTFSAS